MYFGIHTKMLCNFTQCYICISHTGQEINKTMKSQNFLCSSLVISSFIIRSLAFNSVDKSKHALHSLHIMYKTFFCVYKCHFNIVAAINSNEWVLQYAEHDGSNLRIMTLFTVSFIYLLGVFSSFVALFKPITVKCCATCITVLPAN